MGDQVLVTGIVTLLLIIVSFLIFRVRDAFIIKSTETSRHRAEDLPNPTELAKSLKVAIPEAVVLSTDRSAFEESIDSYWARHHREVTPACFVRPNTTEQLQTVIGILTNEHKKRLCKVGNAEALFTIRAGGAAPAIGCSTLEGGVVIDLSRFREVTPSADGTSVTIGAGLKWKEVYEKLDEKGLAVAGGRTTPPGVGGLTLQGYIFQSLYCISFLGNCANRPNYELGGLSFHSPLYGLVCSTVISYEVVLANGTAVTASESSYPDLWRALKGGSNNFGVVTRFTLPCFPASKIWFGCLFMASFQLNSLIKAFHDQIEHASSGKPGAFDKYATVPIVCFAYLRDIGTHGLASYLGYTNPPTSNRWPAYWKKSAYGSLYPLWSTAKVQTLTSAVGELSGPSPAGNYNIMATTTCKNDMETLRAVHSAYRDFSTAAKNVKGLLLSLVLQPLLPGFMNKGHPNILGLEDCTEALIIVEITAKWDNTLDNSLVRSETRRYIQQVETASMANNAYHRYKFANYSAEWQNPMASYGEENLEFMREVSRKYDPKGLFQTACPGGFKLGMSNPENLDAAV
jgi:hypothetical protein